MKIHISLRFFASLSQRMPENPEQYAVLRGTTLGEVLSTLGITDDEAKLVFINHRRAALSSVLKDGDRIGVFPPVGGG